ncbi:MAG: hypothetical protein AAB305_04420, partial [Candidatus Zixiibacteriota bacterium]
KIAEVLKGAILKVIQSDKVLLRGDFLWPADMAVPPIRDRSKLASTEKNIDLIAPEEIAEAIKKVICESCGIGPDAMASATCRRLGFVHVTEGMKERVNYLVSNLLKSKSILERDGQLFESLSK